MRIGIVDAQHSDRLWTLQIIEQFPENWYIVGTAENGYEGMKLIEDLHPDVVFTDILLPRISGPEMIRNVRNKGINPVFIILTASKEFSHVQEALNLCVYRYFTKPIQASTLHRTLLDLDAELSGSTCPPKNPADAAIKYDYLTDRILKRIHHNYAQNLQLNELAEHYHVTPEYLSRVFKQSVGMGFSEYLQHYRIEKAQEMFRDTGKKVYEIAYLVGYHDVSYFCRAFKKITGCSPSEYIRLNISPRK